MTTNWIAATGVGIEFIGFVILAWELIQTNRAAVAEAKELAREKSPFDTMTVWVDDEDPQNGETEIKGGTLGKMLEHIKHREIQLVASTKMIGIGVAITAFGSLLQIYAAVAQALS